MDKIVKLTLPAFAFLDDHISDKGGELHGRNVILHIRSASIVEVFDRDDVVLSEDILYHHFIYVNSAGIKERMLIALHYCATLDVKRDADLLKREVLIPAAKWYCDYCEWEDNNIIQEQ